MEYPRITHHGAQDGVTGSCHQLHITQHSSVLIDCGLFPVSYTHLTLPTILLV